MIADADWITLLRPAALSMSVALLVTAACSDLLSRTIPDTVCIALACLGAVSRGALGFGAVGLSAALALTLFLLLAVAHARGSLGGGDVKLIAAVALGLSPLALYRMLLCTAFAGGGLALLHLVLRHTPAPTRSASGASRMRRLWTIEKWRWRRPDCLPYGVAIACGGIFALLAGTGS